MRRLVRRHLEDELVRAFISLVVIIYLVGVGVALAPTFQANWSTSTTSRLAAIVASELPGALSWPATVYRRVAGNNNASAADTTPQ